MQYKSSIVSAHPTDLLDDDGNPTTPFFKAFGRKPRKGNLRVFGCPVSYKRYNPLAAGTRLTKKQQVQRSSTRGIFVGLPPTAKLAISY